jgi:hypothetical protein
MAETHYVLEDGTTAAPHLVAPDEAGLLRNDAGVAVAMRGEPFQVPSTRSVEVSADAEAKPEPEPKAKPKPGYKTRKAV